jgi:hypothetical protein
MALSSTATLTVARGRKKDVSASHWHCIHEEEEGGGRALALGILVVAAASLSLGGGLVAVGGLGDLDGLLDDLRLERHPDLFVEAAAVHVDEDDGDILVAGLAARDRMGFVLVRDEEDEEDRTGRQAGEVTIW